MTMFCYQCEQTDKGTGCTSFGVCGKDPTTAALQDLLVYAVKGLAMYAHRARQLGAGDDEVNVFTIQALFATVTNVNFDPDRLGELIVQAAAMRDRARQMYRQGCEKAGHAAETLGGPADWAPADDVEGLVRQGEAVGIARRRESLGDDIAGLGELLMYGLKGTAAYADHARILGRADEQVYAFFHEALDFLTRTGHSQEELLSMILRCGEVNLKVMGMLDEAHTSTYGHPRPTPVRVTAVKGKAIAVSGHDLKDLEELLKQTQGTGINIYTHGEMLAAHGYPALKKYPHLVGNYGGAWQDQRKEFDEFPGAILMTTNCIQKPRGSYKGRLFTCGLVAWPGVRHIKDRNFKPLIDAALAAGGFARTAAEKTITVGFAHDAVMKLAGQLLDAVGKGAIRHFFLIGGCDGAKSGRNYYTEFAQAVPKDCVIITLACGRYRFNKLDFGQIATDGGGIPRLLDCGQCNDAYSAIQIAAGLAEALGTDVNKLPLSMVLSWYEQKAVCILLTLLHLGIKGIRLGPSLPACVTPAVLDVLVKAYDIKPITTPAEDLAAILG